jgi:hypothetical protein
MFIRAPKEEWLFAKDLPVGRKHRLRNAQAYEEIVKAIVKELESVSLSLETPSEQVARESGVARPLIKLRVARSLVDLFHNSSSGYRAQFWHDVELGEAANRYAIEKLLPPARVLLKSCRISQSRRSIVDASLQPSALKAMKLWIHQGLWCRYRRLDERLLQVGRWHAQQNSGDHRARKLAIYGSLVPENESFLELKGGWVFPNGESWNPNNAKNRAEDIYRYGFT